MVEFWGICVKGNGVMKSLLIALFLVAPTARAETVVYIAEGGHNCVAVYSLDEEAATLSRMATRRSSGILMV